MDNKKNIHKYFKVGDIVRCEEIWGKQLFVVDRLTGNWYLPELIVYFHNKPKTPGNMCNFSVCATKLIKSNNRPFRKLKMTVLSKLLKKGNVDAIREIILRNRKDV